MMLKLKFYKSISIYFFISLVFSSFISYTFASQLDESIKKQGFNNISSEIFNIIKKDSRIALSPVSSLNNKKILPAITSTVHSEIKSSLTEMSKFSVYLVDKTKLEDAWSNAIEFNKLKFDNIIKDAKFDYLLKSSVDTSKDHLLIQVSITSTKGGSVGKVVYDSGLKKIPFNWKDLEGVEIIDQADAAKMLNKIKKLEQRNLIIENPKTFEEFYINYKIFSSKNALQDALRSLQNAIKIDNTYVDLIDDFINYSFIEYGTINGVNYLKNKLFPLLDKKRKVYVSYIIGEIQNIFVDCDFTAYRLDGNCNIDVKNFFLPSLNQLIKRDGRFYVQKELDWSKQKVKHYIILEASRQVINAEKDNSFSKYYIDKQRASRELQLQNAYALEGEFNFARYNVSLIKNYIPGNGSLVGFIPVDLQTGKSIIVPSYEWLEKNNVYSNWGSLEIINPLTHNYSNNNRWANAGQLKRKFAYGGYVNILNLSEPKYIKFMNPRINYINKLPQDWYIKRSLLFYNHDIPVGDDRALIRYKYKDQYGPCAISLGLLDQNNLRSFPSALKFTKETKVNGITSASKLFKASYPLVNGLKSNYWPKILDKEGNKFHTESILSSANDRLLWADYCLLEEYSQKVSKNLRKNIDNDNKLEESNGQQTGFRLAGFNFSKNKKGLINFEFPVINKLQITDNVDVNRPIIITGVNPYSDNYSPTNNTEFDDNVIIKKVTPNKPADIAGLKAGDKVISINNKKVKRYSDFSEEIAGNPDVSLIVEVSRNNSILSFNVTPRKSNKSPSGKIGVHVNKPEIIGLKGKHLVEYTITDISADGTLFDPFGIDLDDTSKARCVPPYCASVLFENGWLNAPGNVQSLIGMIRIDSITYYDIYGRKKTISPNNNFYGNLKYEPGLPFKDFWKKLKLVDVELTSSPFFTLEEPSVVNQNIYNMFTLLADQIPQNWKESERNIVNNIKVVFDELSHENKNAIIYKLNDKIPYAYKMHPVYSKKLGPLSLKYVEQAFIKLQTEKQMKFDFNTREGILKFFREIMKL